MGGRDGVVRVGGTGKDRGVDVLGVTCNCVAEILLQLNDKYPVEACKLQPVL